MDPFNFMFKSNQQAFKIINPGSCTFDNPSSLVMPKFSAILCFWFFLVIFIGYNKTYFHIVKMISKWIAVISFIPYNSFGALLGTIFSSTFNIHVVKRKRFLSRFYFRFRGRRKDHSQKNPLALDHHHPFPSFALFGFPKARIPLFTGAKLPYIKVSSQSSTLFSLRLDKNLPYISSQIPHSFHCYSRIRHIDELEYLYDKSCQREHGHRTKSLPSRTSRFS